MPENDQTRWIGIRPTNPAENIPVTESAPLTTIEVEPVPGCANFPVTESAPLTDIKVSPSAGSPQFLILAAKRAPAISDLQAIENVIQHRANAVAGAGAFNVDCAQVPVGKIWVITHVICYVGGGSARTIGQHVREGLVDKLLINYSYLHNPEITLISTRTLYLTASQFIRFTFGGTGTAGNYKVSYNGYQIDIY